MVTQPVLLSPPFRYFHHVYIVFLMAIIINISQPKEFLEVFKKEIDEGVIASWSYDEDGDFTLTNAELVNKAWLHPYIKENGSLVLGILGRKNALLTIAEYSSYHSAMVETIILYFNKIIEKISIVQPMVSDYDTHSIDCSK